MRLLILFKDKVGNIVDSTTYKFNNLTDGDNLVERQGIPREVALAYERRGSTDDLPNVFRSHYARTANQQKFLTDGAYTLAPETDINVTPLGKAVSVEVQIEPWKGR